MTIASRLDRIHTRAILPTIHELDQLATLEQEITMKMSDALTHELEPLGRQLANLPDDPEEVEGLIESRDDAIRIADQYHTIAVRAINLLREVGR